MGSEPRPSFLSTPNPGTFSSWIPHVSKWVHQSSQKTTSSLEFSHRRMLSAASNRIPNSKYIKPLGNVPFHIKTRPANAAAPGLVNVVEQTQCWGPRFLCLSTGPPSVSWLSLLAQLPSFSQDAFPGSKSHKRTAMSGSGKAKLPLTILF